MTNKTTLAALIGPWLLVQSYSLAQENKVVLGPRHQRDQNSEKQFNGTVPIGWEKDEEAANKLGSLLCPGTKRNKTKKRASCNYDSPFQKKDPGQPGSGA